MGKKVGKKAANSTELSRFLEAFYTSVDETKRRDAFAFEVFDNFTSAKEGYDLARWVCNEYTPTIGTYVAGHTPGNEFLGTVIGCHDPNKFSEWVNRKYPEYSSSLVSLAKKYEKGPTTLNYGLHLAEILERILKSMRKHADNIEVYIDYDPFDEDAIFDSKAIGEFRDILMSKSGCVCEYCGKTIFLDNGLNDGHVMLINPEKRVNPTIEDVVLLCSDHFHEFSDKPTSERKPVLSKGKRLFENRVTLEQTVIGDGFDERMEDLLTALDRVGYIDPKKIKRSIKLRMKPKKVEAKLHDEPILAAMIRAAVSVGYPKICKAFENLAKKKAFVSLSEQMRLSMRKAYLDLRNTMKEDKEAVFLALVNGVQCATLKKWSDCAALVAFYIQDCEVFDAPAE